MKTAVITIHEDEKEWLMDYLDAAYDCERDIDNVIGYRKAKRIIRELKNAKFKEDDQSNSGDRINRNRSDRKSEDKKSSHV